MEVKIQFKFSFRIVVYDKTLSHVQDVLKAAIMSTHDHQLSAI